MYIDAECCPQTYLVHSDCHVQRLTVQNIYCTNTVQTLQSVTELYLQ